MGRGKGSSWRSIEESQRWHHLLVHKDPVCSSKCKNQVYDDGRRFGVDWLSQSLSFHHWRLDLFALLWMGSSL
jgi:hypothetical protein